VAGEAVTTGVHLLIRSLQGVAHLQGSVISEVDASEGEVQGLDIRSATDSHQDQVDFDFFLFLRLLLPDLNFDS